jgi:hypothetical protein
MQVQRSKAGPDANKIGVRRETKRKFERIAKANRWSLVETADALADEYLKRVAQGANGVGEAGVKKEAAAEPSAA